MKVGDTALMLSQYYTSLQKKIHSLPDDDKKLQYLKFYQELRIKTAFYYFFLEYIIDKQILGIDDELTSAFFSFQIGNHIHLLLTNRIYKDLDPQRPDLTRFGRAAGPYRYVIEGLFSELLPQGHRCIKAVEALNDVKDELLAADTHIAHTPSVRQRGARSTVSSLLRLAHFNSAPEHKLSPPSDRVKKALLTIRSNLMVFTVGNLMRLLAGYANGLRATDQVLEEMDNLVDCEQAYSLLNQYIELGYYESSTYAQYWGFFEQVTDVIGELYSKNIPCLYPDNAYLPIEKRDDKIALRYMMTHLGVIIDTINNKEIDLGETSIAAFATPEKSSQLLHAAQNIKAEFEKQNTAASNACRPL